LRKRTSGRNKKSRFECENGFLKSGSASCKHIGNYYGRPRLKFGLYWQLHKTTRERLVEKWIVERKKDQFPHGNSFMLENTEERIEFSLGFTAAAFAKTTLPATRAPTLF
jgi:hypothetical protein